MSYCARSDVQTRLPQLAPAGFNAVVDAAIAQATSEIDTKLSGRYVVPFADIAGSPPTPQDIVDLCADLASGYAGKNSSARAQVTDQAKQFLKDAQERIARLAKGEESLPGIPVKPQFFASQSVEGSPLDPLMQWSWFGLDRRTYRGRFF